jgi:frataxin
MDASQFESLADKALSGLQAAIEEAADDEVDSELVGGILALELEGGGIYQINKHLPSRQIWLSSPASGAWHFAWSEGEGLWRATRGGERLESLLERELSQRLGKAIRLD